MNILKKLALFMSALTQLCYINAVMCGNEDFNTNEPYNNMPEPVCFQPLYKLYTRTATNLSISSSSSVPAAYDGNKKTIFIVHGYKDNSESGWMNSLKSELLKKGDFNVILVDWSSGAYTFWLWNYEHTAANARVCGKALHDLFKHLIDNGGLSRSNSHCIGHSLGGHVCGYAGQYLKFGRVSGLDPAGPEFEGLPSNARLSKHDGDFVDVIHTDGGGSYIYDYGMLKDMGHVDFYPNGGEDQKGCFWNKKSLDGIVKDLDLSQRELETLDRTMRGALGCSHGRAIFLYIESVSSKCFVATKKCTDYDNLLDGWFSSSSCSSCGSSCQIMGYNSIDNPDLHGMFFLETTNGDSGSYCKTE